MVEPLFRKDPKTAELIAIERIGLNIFKTNVSREKRIMKVVELNGKDEAKF